MSIADNIKRIREQKGLTQEQLGDQLGVAKQTISSYESGRRRPKLETLLRFAQALDVPVEDLLEGVNDTDGPDDAALRALQSLAAWNQEARQAAQQGDVRRLQEMQQALAQLSDDLGAGRILEIFQALNPANRERLISYAEGLAAAQSDLPKTD